MSTAVGIVPAEAAITRLVHAVLLEQDIPGIGLLFQSRRNTQSRTQLIFFLRVNILEDGKTYETRIHRPGEGMQRLDREAGLTVPKGNGPYPVTVNPRLEQKIEDE